MQPVLDDVQQRHPDLWRQLVLHRTGQPPPNLEGVRAVVFWLRNPLRITSPACFEEAIQIAEQAKRARITLINPPDVIGDFTKSHQARVWREANLPTPPVDRFETIESLKDAAERLTFPLMLRGDEQHCQLGAQVIETKSELLALAPSGVVFPCAASPFIDVRLDYRETVPRSAFAVLFHKKRLIVANDIIRTKHTMFAADPIVSAKTSVFAKARRLGRFDAAFMLRSLHRECVRHDLAYWEQKEEHRALMSKACQVLGLRFAGIDYSNLADGTPILWEANPWFSLPKPNDIMLPRYRRAPERVASYHEAVARFLTGLLSSPGDIGASEAVVTAGSGWTRCMH
jgi:hypothetical protein